PADRPGRAQVAAMVRDHAADLAGGPVAVVGHDLDQHRRAARAEHLVPELLEIAGPLLDRPVDGVVGHVHGAGLVDGGAQARIAVDVTAAQPGRDGQLLDDLGPQLRLLGVRSFLLVLYLGPPVMAGHGRYFLSQPRAFKAGRRRAWRPAAPGSTRPADRTHSAPAGARPCRTSCPPRRSPSRHSSTRPYRRS